MELVKKQVAVIGLGAIGKNHFRALLHLSAPTDFYLVDPMFNAESERVLREEAESYPEHQLSFYLRIEQLPNSLDLAVVATKADIRLEVLEELLKASRVEYLILEKVLFQELAHYSKAESMLSSSGTTCWVHHTRRAFPFYSELQESMKDDQNIRVEVTGGHWGMACNGLHFLDLFEFLIRDKCLSLDISQLEPRILPSKRQGFKEVIGTVSAIAAKGHNFSMTSFDFEFPLEIKIYSRERSLQIDELNQWVRCRTLEGKWLPEIKEVAVVHYISQFTNRIAETIFKTGECKLPSYAESSKLHQLYLSSLMNHFESVEQVPCHVCPVT